MDLKKGWVLGKFKVEKKKNWGPEAKMYINFVLYQDSFT